MNGITQWEVVTVIVVLMGMIGTIFGGISKFNQPIQELKETTLKLNLTLGSINKAIDRIEVENKERKDYTNSKIHDIEIRLDRHKILIQQLYRELGLHEEHQVENKE